MFVTLQNEQQKPKIYFKKKKLQKKKYRDKTTSTVGYIHLRLLSIIPSDPPSKNTIIIIMKKYDSDIYIDFITYK